MPVTSYFSFLPNRTVSKKKKKKPSSCETKFPKQQYSIIFHEKKKNQTKNTKFHQHLKILNLCIETTLPSFVLWYYQCSCKRMLPIQLCLLSQTYQLYVTHSTRFPYTHLISSTTYCLQLTVSPTCHYWSVQEEKEKCPSVLWISNAYAKYLEVSRSIWTSFNLDEKRLL